MKYYNQKKGKKGEGLAADYLRKKGYKVIERNWGNKWGEVDLIVLKDKVLVFVEVKTKFKDKYGNPEEMVDRRKLEQVQKTAEMYLQKYPKYREGWLRVDVVGIVLEPLKIKHYKNVY
jgi:putative endonuclease